MANKKNKSRKQGFVSKFLNAALIALGFSRVLTWVASGGFSRATADNIIREATFGLSAGSFDLNAGLRMYTPVAGAVALGTLKSYLMKRFPVRG